MLNKDYFLLTNFTYLLIYYSVLTFRRYKLFFSYIKVYFRQKVHINNNVSCEKSRRKKMNGAIYRVTLWHSSGYH